MKLRPPARALLLTSALLAGACTSASLNGGEGGSGGGAGAPGSTSSSASGGEGGSDAKTCDDPPLPEQILAEASDPHAGEFTLEEALDGLPQGPGPLRAEIVTELGALVCQLYPDKAPNAVANFVGLARGRRAHKDPATKKWVKRRFYDGLTFHRVIDDFMIQGGDPLGTGFGGPGYKFADEISDLKHEAGTLAYANSGKDTNGSQFYITELPQPHLDGGYTVFGACEPLSRIAQLAATPTDAKDAPITPVHMLSVTVTRCAPR